MKTDDGTHPSAAEQFYSMVMGVVLVISGLLIKMALSRHPLAGRSQGTKLAIAGLQWRWHFHRHCNPAKLFCCLAILSADRNRIRFLRTGCEPDRTRHPSIKTSPFLQAGFSESFIELLHFQSRPQGHGRRRDRLHTYKRPCWARGCYARARIVTAQQDSIRDTANTCDVAPDGCSSSPAAGLTCRYPYLLRLRLQSQFMVRWHLPFSLHAPAAILVRAGA
jgi:hypothetical protein